MEITEQQYDAVINGIRVQHEIFRQKMLDKTNEIGALRMGAKLDDELITELQGAADDLKVEIGDLQMDLAAEIQVSKDTEGANAILKEMVATQERALAQAKGKAKSKKSDLSNGAWSY